MLFLVLIVLSSPPCEVVPFNARSVAMRMKVYQMNPRACFEKKWKPSWDPLPNNTRPLKRRIKTRLLFPAQYGVFIDDFPIEAFEVFDDGAII